MRALEQPEREVVEQLVGEDDAGEGSGRQLGQRGDEGPETGDGPAPEVGVVGADGPEREAGGLQREPFRLAAAQDERAFDQDIAQRDRTRRPRVEDGACERPRAGARLDDHERVGPVELVPPRVQCPGQHGPEERAHLGTGDEVAAAAPGVPAPPVEAGLVVVERQLDQLVEAQRTEAADPLGDEGRYFPGDATT